MGSMLFGKFDTHTLQPSEEDGDDIVEFGPLTNCYDDFYDMANMIVAMGFVKEFLTDFFCNNPLIELPIYFIEDALNQWGKKVEHLPFPLDPKSPK
jgi:hypothetical protein